MTRKRFVKLLMSKGYSRNTAVGVAGAAKMEGGSISYNDLYKRKLLVFYGARDITSAVIDFSVSVKTAAESFLRFAEAEKNVRAKIVHLQFKPTCDTI